MPQVVIQFDPRQLASVQARLAGLKDGVPKALAGAINDTGKQERTQISKNIREKLNIKKKDLDPNISVSPMATPSSLKGGVHLAKTKRLGLGYFDAKQTAAGVSYKIMVGGARKTIPHAFGPKIARLGHQPFVRTGVFRVPKTGRYAGKVYKRGPKKGQRYIREVIAGPKRGLSAWGYFLKAGLFGPTVRDTEQLLQKNVEARTRFLILKANGEI